MSKLRFRLGLSKVADDVNPNPVVDNQPTETPAVAPVTTPTSNETKPEDNKPNIDELAKKPVKLTELIGKFDITSYTAFRDATIFFYAKCDHPVFAKRILENKLNKAEKNFIFTTISEWFDERIKTDEKLFDYGVGNLLIDFMEGTISKNEFPTTLINKEALSKCMQKKQGSTKAEFNKNKFRALPLADKVAIITDPQEFCYKVWCEDYLDTRYDIGNLVRIEGATYNDSDIMLGVGDDDEEATASTSKFREKLALLSKK
jgi:hypothetical protein